MSERFTPRAPCARAARVCPSHSAASDAPTNTSLPNSRRVTCIVDLLTWQRKGGIHPAGHLRCPRAIAAAAGGNDDELAPAGLIRDRCGVAGKRQLRFPEHLASPAVDCAELP